MNKLFQILDQYEAAIKEWEDFYVQLRVCQSVAGGQELLEEMRGKYSEEFWRGKDYYVKFRLKQKAEELESKLLN